MEFQFMEHLLMEVIVDRVHVDEFDWVEMHFWSCRKEQSTYEQDGFDELLEENLL